MMINCANTRKLLQVYLDRELSPDEVAAVQTHLGRCGSCGDCYRFESDLRRLIRVCADEPTPSSLADRLRGLFLLQS
jgi:mycothiol system anti-sigma-R factor